MLQGVQFNVLDAKFIGLGFVRKGLVFLNRMFLTVPLPVQYQKEKMTNRAVVL